MILLEFDDEFSNIEQPTQAVHFKKGKAMKKVLMMLCMLLLVVTVSEAKVTLVKAVIEPAAAAAGDEVMVTVEFSGKAKNIESVVMIPREFYYDIEQPFPLQQIEEGKNVWVLKGEVPWETPSGSVNLEIKAVDKKGNEIVVEEFKDQEYGKSGLIEFEVK
jgi:hypothetical protein